MILLEQNANYISYTHYRPLRKPLT